MKSDRVSGTSNQIPSTNEIMPDLFHSGITRNSQRTFCVSIYIFESCRARMSDNEQSRLEKDKRKHRSQENKNTQAN